MTRFQRKEAPFCALCRAGLFCIFGAPPGGFGAK